MTWNFSAADEGASYRLHAVHVQSYMGAHQSHLLREKGGVCGAARLGTAWQLRELATLLAISDVEYDGKQTYRDTFTTLGVQLGAVVSEPSQQVGTEMSGMKAC